MPGKNLTPSTLLTAAARAHLQPLGLLQSGKSRVWLDDHAWWLCVVEFQPGRSPGSYLNVGCMWLWNDQNHLSFDEGCRIEPHARFNDPVQFAAEAERLAIRATEEVQRYRQMFPTIDHVCKFYLRKQPSHSGNWQTFHAGVVCAISGRSTESVRFLDRFLAAREIHPEWLVAARADAEYLKALAGNTFEFRKIMAERVTRTRERLKLSNTNEINFEGRAV